MGIMPNKNTPHTLAHFKPGVTHFSHSLKIHKMLEEHIVTCFLGWLINGSDIFIGLKTA